MEEPRISIEDASAAYAACGDPTLAYGDLATWRSRGRPDPGWRHGKLLAAELMS